MRGSTTLTLSHRAEPRLIPAVKQFVTAIEETTPARSGSKPPHLMLTGLHVFSKCDFETAFSQVARERGQTDPLQADIVATAGRLEKSWRRLVDTLVGEYQMDTSGFYYYEAGPEWVIQFSRAKDPAFLIANLGFESLLAEITVPAESAEQISARMSGFAPSICHRRCSGTS